MMWKGVLLALPLATGLTVAAGRVPEKIFEDFILPTWDYEPHFYGEVPPGRDTGKAGARWWVDGNDVRQEFTQDPDGKRPLYHVTFDEGNHPREVTTRGTADTKKWTFTWRHGHPVSISRQDGPSQEEEIELMRDDRGRLTEVHVLRRGFSLWSETRHARGDETVAIGLFPSGEVKHLTLYRAAAGKDWPLGIRHQDLRKKAVWFETARPAPGAEMEKRANMGRGPDLERILSLTFKDFGDWQTETWVSLPGNPGEGRRRITANGGEPVVEFLREGRVRQRVTLKGAAPAKVPAMCLEWDDGFAPHWNYTLEENDGLAAGVSITHTVQEGLWKSSVWADATGMVKRLVRDFYPNRHLMREQTFIGDRLVKSRLHHAEEDAEVLLPGLEPGPGAPVPGKTVSSGRR